LKKALLKENLYNNNLFIPQQLKNNSKFFRNVTNRNLNKPNLNKLTNKKVFEFFDENHYFIKYGTQRWFLINAGFACEIFTIQKNLGKNFIQWLKIRKVNIGDQVVHIHIISNKERQERLKKTNFNIPYKHLDKEYYFNALKNIADLIKENNQLKGLFCDVSWVFDPNLHKTASDGKPFV